MLMGAPIPLAGLPPLWTAADDREYDRIMAHRARRAAVDQRVRGAGRTLGRLRALAALLAVGGAGWALAGALHDPAAALADSTRRRDLICAASGTVFRDHPIGDSALPATNPHSGAATLYPAERCYWTRDGRATLEPTYVLLNMYRGSVEVTHCPNCGREVVYDNPMPPVELMVEALDRGD